MRPAVEPHGDTLPCRRPQTCGVRSGPYTRVADGPRDARRPQTSGIPSGVTRSASFITPRKEASSSNDHDVVDGRDADVPGSGSPSPTRDPSHASS